MSLQHYKSLMACYKRHITQKILVTKAIKILKIRHNNILKASTKGNKGGKPESTGQIQSLVFILFSNLHTVE